MVETAIISDRARWAGLISARWRSAVEDIIATGRLLIEAKAALRHGEWLPMLREDLPFSEANAQRLMQIGRDTRLSDPRVLAVLPPHWSTIHALTKLTDAQFWRAVDSGVVRPDMERKHVKATQRAASTGDGPSAFYLIDGKAIGDVSVGELQSRVTALKAEIALLTELAGYATPTSSLMTIKECVPQAVIAASVRRARALQHG